MDVVDPIEITASKDREPMCDPERKELLWTASAPSERSLAARHGIRAGLAIGRL